MIDYLTDMYTRLDVCSQQSLDQVQAAAIRGEPDVAPNFGLDVQEEAENPLPPRSLHDAAPHLETLERRDTGLWAALFAIFPSWSWGRQLTGDCTRWGKQHGLDCGLATAAINKLIAPPTSLVAGEVLYGAAKSNLPQDFRRKRAGSTSWAISEAARRFGWVHRGQYQRPGTDEMIDLSQETRYSVTWGERPGTGVPDWLLQFASRWRAVDRVQVTDTLEAGLLIQAGYAVDYAGTRAAWPRTRGADGIGVSFSASPHMMCLTGVRWNRDGFPHSFWVANTGHGAHVTGPVGPIPVPEVYAACGGWVLARTVSPYLGNAHTMITGWPQLTLPDWGASQYL